MNPCPRHLLFAGAVLLALTGWARAERLANIGPTYPIAEQSILKFIHERLAEKQRTGELAILEAKVRDRNTEAVRNPPAVPGIVRTETARTFYFDPSFVLDRNVEDAQGRVLFPAGTRKNPLEVVSLSRHLLFFDARDEQQVALAKALIAHYQGKVKPILVGGSYLELMKRWKTQVFYDQQGVLTKRFGIRQVPAIVSQEGARLRIDEIKS